MTATQELSPPEMPEDLREEALDARGLARRLAKYDVRPKVYRDGERTVRGYEAADLADPWSRYVTDKPSTENFPTPQEVEKPANPGSEEGVTGVTPQQPGAAFYALFDRCSECGFDHDAQAPLADAWHQGRAVS